MNTSITLSEEELTAAVVEYISKRRSGLQDVRTSVCFDVDRDDRTARVTVRARCLFFEPLSKNVEDR